MNVKHIKEPKIIIQNGWLKIARNINKVKNMLQLIFEKVKVISEKLFNNEKNKIFEKTIATKKVNQSDAIVVFTLLFLT